MQTNVSGSWLRHLFNCTPDSRRACQGRCCCSSKGQTLISLLPAEVTRFEQAGKPTKDGLLLPDPQTGRCPFQDLDGTCAIHDSKPFGCATAPFTLSELNTLIQRHRYLGMPCHGHGQPAYITFRPSLDRIYGKEEAARICALLATGADRVDATMADEIYEQLKYLDKLKKTQALVGAAPAGAPMTVTNKLPGYGAWIRDQRRAKHWSQKLLAQKLGITEIRVSYLEREHLGVDPTWLAQLEQLFGAKAVVDPQAQRAPVKHSQRILLGYDRWITNQRNAKGWSLADLHRQAGAGFSVTTLGRWVKGDGGPRPAQLAHLETVFNSKAPTPAEAPAPAVTVQSLSLPKRQPNGRFYGFGPWIKQQRQQRHWTQSELVKQAGWPYQSGIVGRWEQGKRPILGKQLTKLEQLFQQAAIPMTKASAAVASVPIVPAPAPSPSTGADELETAARQWVKQLDELTAARARTKALVQTLSARPFGAAYDSPQFKELLDLKLAERGLELQVATSRQQLVGAVLVP